MKHRRAGRKLNRDINQRKALFKNLIAALILKGKVQTTEAKAKAVRPLVEKLITKAKKNTLASKRQVLKRLKNNKKISTILWTDIAKTFTNRTSGFTRIIPLTQRKGDMAKMVRLEWTEIKIKEEPKKEDLKAKKGKKQKATKESKIKKVSKDKNTKKVKDKTK